MGTPRIIINAPSSRKSKHIMSNFSRKQDALLREAAEEVGEPLSEYIRNAALARAREDLKGLEIKT